MKKNIIEHYRVPDGYFEQFARDMMDKLPEQPFQPMNVVTTKVSPRWYAVAASVAAIVVAVFAATSLFIYNQDEEQLAKKNTVVEEYSVDETADYVLIDHQDLYELITQ